MIEEAKLGTFIKVSARGWPSSGRTIPIPKTGCLIIGHTTIINSVSAKIYYFAYHVAIRRERSSKKISDLLPKFTLDDARMAYLSIPIQGRQWKDSNWVISLGSQE